MIELGKKQTLKVIRKASVGLFLNSANDPDMEDILLPNNQVEGLKLDDDVEVFVYKDSEDRMIATRKVPKITLGQISSLMVKEVTRIGAFLDWGLDKDLLLPFKEQIGKVKSEHFYLVCLYIDKTDRLCATMKISKYLQSHSPYKMNDIVKGTIYSINRDIGAFVAVENKYHGLIPNSELTGHLFEYGDKVEARIKRVKSDGKLELSLRKEVFMQMDDDAEKIYARLAAKKGFLKLNDNSPPSAIKAEFNMSKSAFKRAIGRLLREQKINITDKGIELRR